MKMNFRQLLFLFLFSLFSFSLVAQTVSSQHVSPVDTLLQGADSSVLRTISPATWKKISNDKQFIYTKTARRPKAESGRPTPWLGFLTRMFSAKTFTVLMFVLAAGLLLLVIRHLFFTGGPWGYRWKKKTKVLVRDEPGEDDLRSFHDWDNALQEACSKRNYREAVRLLYLQTLAQLDSKSLIRYQAEKTNRVYLNELESTPHAAAFRTLTRYFDYIWYGQFDLDETQFGLIATLYRNFQHTIQ